MAEVAPGKVRGLRERFAAGKPSYGLIATIPSIQSVQILANAGVDWSIIDTEHAPIDVSAMHAMIVATSGTSTLPFGVAERVE